MRTSDGQIQRNQAASPDEAEADPQMAAFQDMLSEYLRCEYLLLFTALDPTCRISIFRPSSWGFDEC